MKNCYNSLCWLNLLISKGPFANFKNICRKLDLYCANTYTQLINRKRYRSKRYKKIWIGARFCTLLFLWKFAQNNKRQLVVGTSARRTLHSSRSARETICVREAITVLGQRCRFDTNDRLQQSTTTGRPDCLYSAAEHWVSCAQWHQLFRHQLFCITAHFAGTGPTAITRPASPPRTAASQQQPIQWCVRGIAGTC